MNNRKLLFLDINKNKQKATRYLEEKVDASIKSEIPDEILDLLKRLNSYDYGYIVNGKKESNMDKFFDNYKSLTVSEFEKYKIGVCWDYVHYEANWFKSHGYKCETFYIQVQDEDNDCPSHTYLVFYLPGSNIPYYFESSWGKYQGIEKFPSISKLHDTIKDRHIECAQSKCDPKTYFRVKYNASSKSLEHLGCGQYMVKVSKGRIKINESLNPFNDIEYLEESSYFPNTEYLEEKFIVTETTSNNMYFISQSNMDSKTLHPKVPDNYFTKNGYEDNKTARVCFAPSIDQCLMGLSQNCTGKEYYVHIPDSDSVKVYRPNTKEVPDSKITGEMWVNKDVKLKCIGKIKVIKDKGTPGKVFSYGDKTAELYEWDWKWISRGQISETVDVDYGLPDLKKYPMPDEKHVLSAIRFFNYVSPENEKELAKNIKKKMKQYNIKPDRVGDKNRLKKYLSEDTDILTEFTYDNFDGHKPILVFDIGDVLVGFRNNTIEGAIINSVYIPSDIAKDVYSYISNTFSKNYDYLDSASESDYYTYMIKHSPVSIKKYIPAALKAIVEDAYKLHYTDELLSKLKGEEYTMYYLSNWSRWSRDMLLKNGTFDFLKYFDGGIFSCDVKLSKPDNAIYELLSSAYNIDLSKCIFFDDTPENIAASIDCGMYGVLFNKEYTQQEIYNSLIN